LQLPFLTGGDLDGGQQGQHTDRSAGRRGDADPGDRRGLQAAEQFVGGRAASVVDAALGRGQLGLLGAGQARFETLIDAVLAAPAVDRLV
jgi:hypothetical protein